MIRSPLNGIYSIISNPATWDPLILRLNNQWSGRGKGLTRAFYTYDKKLADAFFESLEAFYQDENKEPFIQFVTEIYKPLGGFLFEGFSMGKNS